MELTKEEQDIICQNVIHGERLTEITDKHNINIEQVFIELETELPEASEFQVRYARAERIRQHRLIDKIFRLSQKLIACEDKEEYRKLKLELDIYKWIVRQEKSSVQNHKTDSVLDTGVLGKLKTEIKSKKLKTSSPLSLGGTSRTGNVPDTGVLSKPMEVRAKKKKPKTNRPLQDLEDRFKSSKISKEERNKKGENFLWLEDFYPNG